MSRGAVPGRDDAPDVSMARLDAVHRRPGFVPGSHPAVLQGYTALSDALARVFDAPMRERIGLALAQQAGCEHTLAEHRYLALDVAHRYPEEIDLNRQGGSAAPRAAAAVRFALQGRRRRARWRAPRSICRHRVRRVGCSGREKKPNRAASHGAGSQISAGRPRCCQRRPDHA
ncbi:hypothetical protein [Burkholderia perseverans]|uniref:hypothetical protein n=1 Tax=Burkholderia perseverans TaxID=2615214 RepID=UPI001FED7B34|nr:hypothetical protein [Burkholderia perseverans]